MMHILITISTLLLLSIWSSIPAEVNGSEQCPPYHAESGRTLLIHISCKAQLADLFTTVIVSSIPAERFTNVDMESLPVETLCPVQNSLNQKVMESFLTKPVWAAQRTETNTANLSMSQITLLNDSSHSSVYTSFNDTYQEAFDEKNGIGETAKNITYYKAGNFYFVIITPRQSDDPNYITFGVSLLHIYDLNIDLVKAYAF